MRRYLPCLLALGLWMVSCVRDVEIELDDLPDRIVLNASVSPGKEVRAHLSKTWFVLDSVPDFDLPGARVSVYVDDRFQGVMCADDQPGDSIHPKGQYVLPGCFVRQGDRLRLEAEADGYEPVSAETRIPGRARIDGVDTLSYRSSAYYTEHLRLSVKMNYEIDAYYRLIVEQVMEYRKGDSTRTVTSFTSLGGYQWYYSGFSVDYEDPVFQSFGGSPITNQMDGRYCMGVFSGKDMVNTKAVKVSVFPVEYSYESDSLSRVVHYDVRLLSISEDYYRYMKIMRGYSITIGDANFGALIEPADAYSNVDNGFGIVAGYQEDKRRVTMPRDTVPPTWNPWDSPGWGFSPSL
ncbi:MAG: DUF4249 domain-containing protein [Parabacteroides sp.]|nr:DUF4249 domain-containing protein [Parabacteroides sp.]